MNSKNSQAAALIASEKPLALSDNWKITVEFSVSSPVPSGPLLFGLYRADTADKKGAYVSDAVLPGGPDKDGSKAVVAMQLVIRPSALFAFSFIDKGNVPRQPGSGLQGDITGKTNYCIEFECNGTAIVATLRQAGGKILDGNQIRISDIEARIGQTVEFAAGDIINNSTSGWDIDIYNIEFVAK